ncbi:SMP-30/gluconolactonase/LRE family protein [Novacetimonas hansenii]|uniref:SMP-30/gluconolactonase/LRE family protein n=1 Tax=Novacetimonas hansenii TaxID=436 RepID=A0AAW5EPH0_NOVHA|nr:SMP-30/gluconolactonase/LRE family protein [Novacetimonas hansenii]MCJ8352676.1 SMP-30/gluconolactonase/LRE family protein [Novacetimonas hansenii]
MDTMTPQCAWDLKAQLGEGPVWAEAEQALYFVDIVGSAIHRHVPATGAQASWKAPHRPGFLVPVADGTFMCGLQDGLHVFDPRTGHFSAQAVVEPEQPGNRINDGYVDPRGRLWFGTMDDGETSPSGALYSVTRQADGSLRIVRQDEGYVVTNGPALSPDGRTLYHNDSQQQSIYAFDLSDDGMLSNRRVFARLTDGYPDGVVVDSAGCLWVGVWGGGRIARFLPDGQGLPPVIVPARNVTKIAFGGADYRTVFVTTARKGLSDDVLATQPQTGGLFTFRVDVPGQPQATFPANGLRELGRELRTPA